MKETSNLAVTKVQFLPEAEARKNNSINIRVNDSAGQR